MIFVVARTDRIQSDQFTRDMRKRNPRSPSPDSPRELAVTHQTVEHGICIRFSTNWLLDAINTWGEDKYIGVYEVGDKT